MKNVRIFYLKISFLVVKFSIYLNRHVFVTCLVDPVKHCACLGEKGS